MREGNARDGREGFIGHRFAAAWVRVRAAFTVVGSCMLRETILRVVRGWSARFSIDLSALHEVLEAPG